MKWSIAQKEGRGEERGYVAGSNEGWQLVRARDIERGEFARKGGDLRRDACVLSRVAYGRAECALFMARK